MLDINAVTFLVVTPDDIESLARGCARRGYTDLQVDRRYGVARLTISEIFADIAGKEGADGGVQKVSAANTALSLVGTDQLVLFSSSGSFQGIPAAPDAGSSKVITIRDMLASAGEGEVQDLFEAGERMTCDLPHRAVTEPICVDAALAARWMVDIITFCLGIEEQKRLFEYDMDAVMDVTAETPEADEREAGPILGRDADIRRAVRILSRSRRNSLLVVGEARVGKSTIIRGLRKFIQEGGKGSSAVLAGAAFHAIDAGDLRPIMIEAPGLPIVHVQDLFEAGCEDVRQGDVEETWRLPPSVGRHVRAGRIRCVAEATPDQLRAMETSPDIRHHFDILHVGRLPDEAIAAITRDEVGRIENLHAVSFAPDAVAVSQDLAARYLPGRPAALAPAEILEEAALIARERKQGHRVAVHGDCLAEAARELSGVRAYVDTTCEEVLREALSGSIVGQEKAIDALVRAVSVCEAGLQRRDRMEGAFLFTGPTGVLKIALARRLADVLGRPLMCWNMSEFAEEQSLTRLVGSSRGYIGSRKGGELTNAVRTAPRSILLFDGIDQAHPAIRNVLIQAIGTARLTDGLGRSVDLRGCLAIMTSDMQGVGAVEAALPPDLRELLDAVVPFRSLERVHLRALVEQEIDELRQLLAPSGLGITATEPAIDYIAARGCAPGMGARALSRYVDREIKPRLARLVGQRQAIRDGTGSGAVPVILDAVGEWLSVAFAGDEYGAPPEAIDFPAPPHRPASSDLDPRGARNASFPG